MLKTVYFFSLFLQFNVTNISFIFVSHSHFNLWGLTFLFELNLPVNLEVSRLENCNILSFTGFKSEVSLWEFVARLWGNCVWTSLFKAKLLIFTLINFLLFNLASFTFLNIDFKWVSRFIWHRITCLHKLDIFHIFIIHINIESFLLPTELFVVNL